MKNKVKAWLFEAPAILLLISAFIASVYVIVAGTYQIGWATPIILLVILVLFFWGKSLENKAFS